MAGGGGTPKTLINAGEATVVQAEDVILRDAGANPAAVVEVVRSMTGLEPSAARELVARTPCAIRTRVAPALAGALRLKLVAAGASVEVRAHGAAPGAPELFDVLLRDHGASKINVIRAVKMMAGLGLKEAIELVDDAPSVVRRKVERAEAETILHELVEAGATAEIRAHDGTAPAAPARASEPASAAEGAPAGPSSGLFEVILQACGPNKIAVIKLIRELTGLGLKEAKDMAESRGATVKEGVGRTEAARIERQFVEIGAVVELRRREDGAGAEDEPARVDVFLRSCGPNKIHVIKEVRALTGLGLKETKDLVEAAPRMLKKQVDGDEARQLQRRLAEVGAVVELR